ncbi:SusC/RagA family TonB-linked outer membrane protein [Pedobacter africanus]|uniref:TonB-linked SusC/RagA family outer membrane protein n=1 Tax=Pedobacter africanus TaxID=151894 RepID=A0ACC6KU68_9SPHI|nr:SusC/RagA family TonB-linked outer membrane protein [Pedobacter africanus]MDR6782908.1 TonB-linked SusC/RagA family outer membrane protein [Pedobacter africanus]
MKITIVLMLVLFMQVSASTFAQKISLNARRSTLQSVLNKISAQTSINYLIDNDLLHKAKPVTLVAHNQELTLVLAALFADQPFDYHLEGNTIEVRPKTELSDALGKFLSYFKAIEVNGQVIDPEGQPLQRATVRAKTGQHTKTDKNGRFFFSNIEEGTELEISYVGYKNFTLKATEKLGIIALQLSDARLDEVTVQAYSKGSRRLATSNISGISGDELVKQPVSDPMQALIGRIPGMVVSQSTGVPGARLNIQIRGRANFDKLLSSDQPLFILDGVPMAAGNDKVNQVTGPFGVTALDGLSALSGLNMADIESIDVLKDADATAIYGSRGANGVILVTTRKGKPGKLRMDINLYSGISEVSYLPKMLNTEQYINMRNEAFTNDKIVKTNSNAYDLLLWDINRYTNFPKLLIGNTAHTNDAQLSFSGGNKNTRYRINGGYHKEGTVWHGNMGTERASMSVNVGTLSEDGKFSVEFSGNYIASKNNLLAVDLATYTVLPPNFRLYDEKGELAWNETGLYIQKDNPLAIFKQKYLAQLGNLNANTLISYKLFGGLVIRSTFGYNLTQMDEKKFIPIAAQNPRLSNLSGQAYFGNNQLKNWIIEPQLEYSSHIKNGNWGKLDVLLGATYNKRGVEGDVTSATGYTSDEMLGSLKGAPGTGITASNTLTHYKYQAFFGRVNYNLADKYIVNFTGRRDGSSRFGPKFRFSNFAAIGAAWIFGEESLLKKNKVLSYGKLRASYGVTGNDQIGEYAYLDAWASAGNYADSSAIYPSKLYNPNLHWESNTKTEVGLELGFLNDRILFTASAYQNISSEPLVSYLLPRTTGFITIKQNLSGVKVRNRGLEFTVTTQNIKRALTWNTDFNISIPQNQLIKFPDLEKSSYARTYTIGESLNRIYQAQYTGVDPATGLYTTKDVNGDNRLNSSNDYAVSGTLDPKFFGGLNNTFTYKGFTLSFFLQFNSQMGRDWRSGNSSYPPGTAYNVPTLALKRWQKEGDITDIQKFTTNSGPITGITGFYAMTFSNRAYTNINYLRLKNISFSYTIPTKLVNAIRVYAQAQNLFVFTNYEGADPETQSYTRMPPLRIITTGLQITL